MSGSTLNVSPLAAEQVLPQGVTSTAKDLDLIQAYFGPPTQKVKPNQYYGKRETHWTLPEAYKTDQLYLKDTVEGLIYERNPWTTGRALPWWYSEQLTVKMDIWRLEQGMIHQEPHEGMPRLLEASKSAWQDAQIRYGIAVKFEGDFYKTAEGHSQFLRYMTGIQKFVQERANADVLHTLLHCKNYQRIWTQLYGESRISFTKLFDDQVHQTAALHDARSGFKNLRILYDKHRQAMLLSTIPVSPDLLIIPPGMGIFLRYGHDKTLEYWAWSNEGALLLRDGPKAWTFDDQVDIVEAPDYGVHESNMPIQHLKRRKIIGQHIPMYAWFRHMENVSGYSNEWRNIYILDLAGERWKKIHFQDAFMRTGIFDDNDGGYTDALKNYITTHSSNWEQYDQKNEKRYALMKDGIPQSEREKCPFFLASDVGQGNFALNTHMGQFQKSAVGMNDFKQMAQTLISQFCPDSETQREFKNIVNLTQTVIHKIESEGTIDSLYKHFKLIIDDIVTKKGVEAAKTHNGTFVIPSSGLFTGFNNGNGLRQLAEGGDEEKSKVSYFMTQLQSFLSRTLPRCEMNDAKNVEPWFKKDDPISVLYSLIGMDRIPLFLNLGYGKITPNTTDENYRPNVGGELDITPVKIQFDKLKLVLASYSDHSNRLTNFAIIFVENLPPLTDHTQIYKIVLQLLQDYENVDQTKNPAAALKGLQDTIDDLYFGTLATFERIPITENKTSDDLNAHKTRSKAFIQKALKTQKFNEKSARPSVSDLSTYTSKASGTIETVENWQLTPLTATPSLIRALQQEKDLKGTPRLWMLVRPADPMTGFKKPIDPMMAPQQLNEELSRFEHINTMYDLMKNPALKTAKSLKITQKMQRQIRGLDVQQAKVTKTEDPFRTSVSRQFEEDDDMALLLSGSSSKFSKIGTGLSTARMETTTPFVFPTEQYSRVGRTDHPDIDRPGFADNWHESNTITDPLVRIFVQCIMTTRCDNIHDWLDLMENNVHVPVNILLWRPAIKLHLYTLILMKSGIETGATLHGHSNFALGSDVLTKTWHGHYTTYMKAMCWKPEHIHLIEDVGCAAYEDGMDGNWMLDPRKTLHHVQESAPMAERGSLLATMVPITEAEPMTNMGLGGKLNVPFHNARLDKPLVNTYSTSAYYAKIWGLDRTISSTRQELLNYGKMSSHFSGNTRPGRYWTYSPATGAYSTDHKGNGHMAGGENPESAIVWKTGEGVFPKESEVPVPHLV